MRLDDIAAVQLANPVDEDVGQLQPTRPQCAELDDRLLHEVGKVMYSGRGEMGERRVRSTQQTDRYDVVPDAW